MGGCRCVQMMEVLDCENEKSHQIKEFRTYKKTGREEEKKPTHALHEIDRSSHSFIHSWWLCQEEDEVEGEEEEGEGEGDEEGRVACCAGGRCTTEDFFREKDGINRVDGDGEGSSVQAGLVGNIGGVEIAIDGDDAAAAGFVDGAEVEMLI